MIEKLALENSSKISLQTLPIVDENERWAKILMKWGKY